ncbi:type I restriction enzyme HsdR protein [Escherichia coli O145:H28]|nr:type I restriction enzyme HsdR protein [Escherichia coli O145:H28]GEH28341.1 type I restriction enzyme HsdR protein [Escherichia coli O145:H28]
MLPSETMIWQPEFTDKTLSRKPGAVQAENSLNPQDIEKVVKTSLLPLLFTACREIGAGMNQVNRIVETIIQILRVGLMKS